MAISYADIGTIYFETKKYDKSLEYFNKALLGFVENFGEENDFSKILKKQIEECKQALGE